MRHIGLLVATAASTACAVFTPVTKVQPALVPRSLDTTIAVATPDDRRFLAGQVQQCYARQQGLIQSEEEERTRVLRTRAMIIAGMATASSLITWFIIRHSVTHGGGIDGAIAATFLSIGALRLVQAWIVGAPPPVRTYDHDRAWLNVVTQVEDWETAARDLAAAQRNAAATSGVVPQSTDPALTAWRHADNALRSTLRTCLP